MEALMSVCLFLTIVIFCIACLVMQVYACAEEIKELKEMH